MLPYHICVEFTNGELMQYFVLGVVFGMWLMYLLLCILCCINRDRKRKDRKRKGRKYGNNNRNYNNNIATSYSNSEYVRGKA